MHVQQDNSKPVAAIAGHTITGFDNEKTEIGQGLFSRWAQDAQQQHHGFPHAEQLDAQPEHALHAPGHHEPRHTSETFSD